MSKYMFTSISMQKKFRYILLRLYSCNLNIITNDVSNNSRYFDNFSSRYVFWKHLTLWHFCLQVILFNTLRYVIWAH